MSGLYLPGAVRLRGPRRHVPETLGLLRYGFVSQDQRTALVRVTGGFGMLWYTARAGIGLIGPGPRPVPVPRGRHRDRPAPRPEAQCLAAPPRSTALGSPR
ncbi:hypothetical protein Snoj_01370 [Streptomyces nojiriensis]|uniref:Uncharacterized protein n=1 Tax=Streptomyces nojiriensis TaxID=66374 RepID=A0ABQ3SDM4_9ACTN|nr:hypothetical protein GCM10010205_75410 [Streptomyces nojiriensis]GHI66219.1 hypothetical protein Snoj_01370 [Streptomyces nojiriensis]